MYTGTHVDKYMNHAKQHDWWEEETKGKTNTEIFRALRNRPVCPRCETIAMRDQGYRKEGTSQCPKCGWRGRTVTLDEVIREQLYK